MVNYGRTLTNVEAHVAETDEHVQDKSCDGCGELSDTVISSAELHKFFLPKDDPQAKFFCVECMRKIKSFSLRYGRPMPHVLLKKAYKLEELSASDRNELRQANRSEYAGVLGGQFRRLSDLRYPGAAGDLRNLYEVWEKWIYKLEELPKDFPGVDDLPLFHEVERAGRVPLLVVVSLTLVDAKQQMKRVVFGGARGKCKLKASLVTSDCPTPRGIYLALDVSFSSEGWKEGIFRANAEEGIALATQFPRRAMQCDPAIACTGSHYQDGFIVLYPMSQFRPFQLSYSVDARGASRSRVQAHCARRVGQDEAGNIVDFPGRQ